MLRSILGKVLRRELPVVRASSDLVDERGRIIADKNFVRISDIPELYSELMKTAGRHIEIDPSDLVGERPPVEWSQCLAGAILNYELTQRSGFRILVDRETYEQFGGIPLRGNLYSVTFQRDVPVEMHEQTANHYAQIAGQIYAAFEEANRNLSQA
jgi:hypothetical protein